MAVQLNHTIVAVRDKKASATFLAEILGLATPTPVGPFMSVEIRGTRRRTPSTTMGAASTSKTHRATTWRY
jgi:hypothetical protein